ncbi:MAG: hypothetical protein ACRDQ0_13585, partial [Pseudonocardia sp.]
QPGPIVDRDDHHVHAVIPALRRELAAYRLPPEPGPPPRPLPALAAAVAHASALRHSATIDALGAELPALLAVFEKIDLMVGKFAVAAGARVGNEPGVVLTPRPGPTSWHDP